MWVCLFVCLFVCCRLGSIQAQEYKIFVYLFQVTEDQEGAASERSAAQTKGGREQETFGKCQVSVDLYKQ